jgi:branched-chain amino acid transport system ATP-binding protein
MLQVDNIHTFYGESHVLHGMSLSVEKGCLSVLLGRNGMGKTTTIRSVIGFTPSRSGEIRFKGNVIQDLPSFQIAKMGIGLSPQGRSVFPNLTVKENLTLAAKSNSGANWTLDKIYSFFPRLKERASSMGGNLSGGEQQMLAIGRALMTNPNMLLLDEPSEGLSPIIVQEVKEIILQLKEEGLSILMVEQNLSLALDTADKVYIVNKGQVVYEGTPNELRKNSEVKGKYLAMNH